MHLSSRFVAPVVGTLVILAGPAALAAQDVDPAIAVEAFTLDVVDGPADEFTVTIDADRYVPETATAADPAPVVLLAHGFGGDKTGYASLAETFADAGYVVVSYSARGFGASTGKIGLDSVDYDVKDVRQLIDEIATWDGVQLDGPGDPRIAMHGDSYGGGITLQVAAVDDRLDAIVPRITWSSLVYSLTPNNLGGVDASPYDQPLGIFKQQWTTGFYALGNAQPFSSPEGFEPDADTATCPGFIPELCVTYTRIAAQGRGDAEAVELIQRSSPDVRHEGITAPAFIIQGQDDTLFNLTESVRNLEAIAANGTPTKLLWFQGGHSGPGAPGETVNGRDPVDVVNTRILAWFQRYLRQDTTADTGPGMEWYRDWIEHDDTNAAAAYDAAPSYPAGTATTFLLSGDGELVTDAADVVAGELSFANPPGGNPPSFSEDALRQSSQEPFEQEGQHVAWTSAPFAEAAEVVGIPELTLPLSSLTGEAHLHLRIYDVAPDGTETLIRLLTSPVYAEDLSEPLVIGHPGFVHRFDAGDAVRVVVAATDSSYANRAAPDLYTVAVDPTSPPALVLPIVTTTSVQTIVDRGVLAPAPVADTRDTLPATGGGSVLVSGIALALGAGFRRRR